MMKSQAFSGVDHHLIRPLRSVTIPALLTLALLSACGSQDSGESAAKQGLSQSKVKVADIEQIAVSTTCQYDWKKKSDGLRANVSINIARIADDAADAARYFDLATRSMNAEEVSDAMDKVSAEARARGQDNALTAGVTGAIGGKGIMFEDLSGIGDKARFQSAAGRVHVLLGNLYYEVTAYHGAEMPMPDSINMEAIRDAAAQWEKDTMPQRKEAAEQLAKAVIANL